MMAALWLHASDVVLVSSSLLHRPSGERVPNVERLIRELSPRVSLLTLDVKLPVRSLSSSLQKWPPFTSGLKHH